jgi:serine/threonine protein kinase
MYGFFDDDNYIYIILEVGTGGQLYHQLRKSEPLPEVRVATIMKQVCDAVNEIHSLKIIHRDIKPENIVLHDVLTTLARTLSSFATSAGLSTKTTD